MGAPVEQPPVMAASGGLTDIPVQMQGYAGGGIVAFGDGGDVPGYSGEKESLVTTSPLGRAFGSTLFPSNINKDRSYQGASVRGLVPSQEVQRLNQEYQALAAKDRTLSGMFGLQQQTPAQQAEAAEVKKQMDNILDQVRQLNTPSRLPSPDPQLITPLMESGAPAPTAQQLPPLASPAPRDIPTSSTLQAPTLKPFDRNAIKLKATERTIPVARGLEDIRTVRRAAEAEEGVDPEMYKRMIEGVETKKGKLEGKKGEAAGQALMAAGLGLLGARRGQEFQTLGASGQKALAAYKDDVKDLRNASEKYDERMETLRMADQQAKRTNSAADLAKRDAEEARVEAAKLERAKAQDELTKTGALVSANVYSTQTQADTAARTAQLSAQTQIKVANLNAQIQKWVASRPPEAIRAIDAYAARRGIPFNEAAKEYYVNQQSARNTYTREEAMKDALKNLENRGKLNPTQAEVQAEITKQLQIYGGVGAGVGAGGGLERSADGTFTYVPQGK
jgi:hypothetical protein